jgi:hypothetical protein
MGKQLVLVGARHAHLTALTHITDQLNRGHEVTLISRWSFLLKDFIAKRIMRGFRFLVN